MTESQKSLGIDSKKILFAATLLILWIAILFGTLHFYEHHLAEGKSANLRAGPRDDERQQLRFESGDLFRETRAVQLEDLDAYSWSDEEHRFAKVPLRRAEEIYLSHLKTYGGDAK